MDDKRTLPLEGVHNFRDYGGYRTTDGGRLKRGLLWRSGQHVDASEADLQAIDALALAHVIDLRGASERSSYPCRRGQRFGAEVIAYDGETANLAPHLEAAGGQLDEAGAHRAMERVYRNLPERKPLHWLLRQYFAVLAAGKGASLVHCLAGKDRTGMAVALLHRVLGVHDDDIMQDYLLTNIAGNIDARIAAGGQAVRAKHGGVSDETIRILMGVDPRYLAAAWDALDQQYGSVDAFLRNEIGVDDARRAALRLHLVEG